MNDVTHGAEAWTPWRGFSPALVLDAKVFTELLGGGQAFRWRLRDGFWQGVWGRNVARLRLGRGGVVEWRCPAEMEPRVAPALADYLALDADFAALADALPWRTDGIVRACMADWRGLRLLRQPLGETLLGFLCSSAKRIPHIERMCDNMAARFGEPIWQDVHALPSWERLAEVHERELRACGLGYRARYVHQTAARLAEEPGWEARIHAASYADAHAWLCELPGVGPKIADCVLLYGAAKLEAFPVDTWILKAMARRYGLDGWRPAQVAQFGRAHFGPLAGLAQQFLFSGERNEKAISAKAQRARNQEQ